MKRIVIIGGGTGTFTLLAGLRKFPSDNTVVVSPADDGGSTGALRRELGVMPVGDIRQCLVGLSYTDPFMRELFSYRFAEGSLAGHTVGNIMLAAAEKITGDIEEAVAACGTLLNVRGRVLPASLKPATLVARCEDGTRIAGEHRIDDPRIRRRSRIASLALRPRLAANPKVLTAIRQADAIVFGPGDLFTSILPNLLPAGIARAVARSSAKKILVTNIATKRGQTDGFRASDFVRVLSRYIPGKKPVDVAIVNTKKPGTAALRASYGTYVEPDTDVIKKMGVVPAAGDLLARAAPRRAAGDTLIRSAVRHDSDKTARMIWRLLP